MTKSEPDQAAHDPTKAALHGGPAMLSRALQAARRCSAAVERLAVRLEISPARTALHAAVWIAAGMAGVAAVLYARLVSLLQASYFKLFASFPLEVVLAGPLLFVMATWLVRRFAPDASGSGIPQVLVAIGDSKQGKSPDELWKSPLVSLRTAVIKVLSSCVGILGGASIGREGPTVQVSAAGFAWIGDRLRKWAPQIEFDSFLTAGAAAGIAAAFNTPIAGVTFALEEIGGKAFSAMRQPVMLAIIVGGIVAQGLSGNYLYFGRPVNMEVVPWRLAMEALLIGAAGGVLGGLFARSLAQPAGTWMPRHWLSRAFLTGAICSAIVYLTRGDAAGSGYEVTRRLLEAGTIADVSESFPFLKFASTVLSYASGMAGGIFSPSLSIGAGMGMAIAKLAGLANFKSCALLGMVAFFSGAVRAPLTAVIIVMEMTDEYLLVIPFMIVAFLAHSVSRRIMAGPLYHVLAQEYRKK